MNGDERRKRGIILNFHLRSSAFICGSKNLNLTVLDVSPKTVSLIIKTEKFRGIKPQMNADERRKRGRILNFHLRLSASICG